MAWYLGYNQNGTLSHISSSSHRDASVVINIAEKMVDGLFAVIPRNYPARSSLGKTYIIAHRGAHDKAKCIVENTLAAFTAAQELGCWGIELDVRATADGVMVVNHDASLSRLWGHDLVLAEITFKALRALVPGIPTLAEVVAGYGKSMHLFIELKQPFNNPQALVEDLKNLIPCQDYHLLSLNAPIFEQLTQFPKSSLLLVAGHNNVKQFCNLSLKAGYGGLLGNYLLLRKTYIEKIRQAKQVFGVGFVNSKYCLYRELNRGISYIFTNKAEKLTRYLQYML